MSSLSPRAKKPAKPPKKEKTPEPDRGPAPPRNVRVKNKPLTPPPGAGRTFTRADEEAHWPAAQVELRAVETLQPYARNARTHSTTQIERLVASIKQWGFTVPVLCDETGEMIAGHARLAAALAMGLKRVPVMVARGWTEPQKRAYVIADNRLAESASWDFNVLAEELHDLRVLDVDMMAVGFSEAELNDLLGDAKDKTAPDGFNEYDENIETDHRCPRCGFEWSGGATHDVPGEQESERIPHGSEV